MEAALKRRGMNERVQALRERSMGTEPAICMERALIETETYRQYEGRVSIPELRALALYRYMENRSLYLGEGELIVGEKTSGPQKAPTFPELCCHTISDMRIMDARELISFKVSPDAFTQQEEVVIPYWQGRTIREKLLASMTQEWKDCYEAGIFTEFMEQRGPGHTVGSNKIYEKGFLDYKAEIQSALEKIDPLTDLDAQRRAEQLARWISPATPSCSWAAATRRSPGRWPQPKATRSARKSSFRSRRTARSSPPTRPGPTGRRSRCTGSCTWA